MRRFDSCRIRWHLGRMAAAFVPLLAPKVTLVEIDHDDLVWLAGLLEGEGSFMRGSPQRPHSPIVAVSMTDHDIIERVGFMLRSAVATCKPQKEHHKTAYTTRLCGWKAVQLMRRLYPYMGQRRKGQILAAIYSYEDRRDWSQRTKATPEVLLRVEQLRADGVTWRKIQEDHFPSISYAALFMAWSKWSDRKKSMTQVVG